MLIGDLRLGRPVGQLPRDRGEEPLELGGGGPPGQELLQNDLVEDLGPSIKGVDAPAQLHIVVAGLEGLLLVRELLPLLPGGQIASFVEGDQVLLLGGNQLNVAVRKVLEEYI